LLLNVNLEIKIGNNLLIRKDFIFKKEIQEEILAILDEQIDDEMNAMEDCYSVAEISREVLLQYKNT